jgi:hypothetical protein
VTLDDAVIEGIEITLPPLRARVRENDIIGGNYHIRRLKRFFSRGGMAGRFEGLEYCEAQQR